MRLKNENMNERLVDLGFGRTNYFPDEAESWSLPFDLPVHHDFYEDENGENRSVLAQVSPHDAALIISNIKPADRNKIIAIILGYNDYEDEGKIMLDYPDVEITDEIVGLESDVVSMLLQVGKITDFRGNTLDEEELYRFGAETTMTVEHKDGSRYRYSETDPIYDVDGKVVGHVSEITDENDTPYQPIYEAEDFGAESTLPRLTPKQMDFLRYSSWAMAYEAYATGKRRRYTPGDWKEDYTICKNITSDGFGNDEVARKTLQSLLEKKVVKATDTSYVRQDGRIRKSYAEQVNENPSLVNNITRICLVLTPIGLEILKRMFARNFKDVVGWKIELTFPSGDTAYLHDVPNDIGKALDSHIGDVKWDSQTERFGADEGDEAYIRYRYGEPLENMSISTKLDSVASSLKDLTSLDMLYTVINNLSTKQANQLINRLYAGIREGSIRRKPFRHNMRMGAEDFGADEDYYEDYIQRIFTFIDEQVGTEYFPSIEDEEEVARFKKGFYDEFDEVGKAIEDANDWSWNEILGADTADVDFDEAYMENQDAERIMKLLRIVRRKATGSNARYAKNYAREAENAYYQYGMKGLKVQVAYVLSNLGGWRGDEAKEVKAELRKLTK